MMNKLTLKAAIAIVVLMQVICLVGCTASSQEQPQAEKRTIVDMEGRTVEIPGKIERIACQSSTCEAVIISLGEAMKLVGTTDYTDESTYAYDLSPELSGVNKLTDDMSVEEMLEKNVQVVFVKDTNKIETYEEAGLPVIYVKLDTIAGTKEGIRIMGEVIGAKEQAEKCVEYINESEQLVRDRLANADNNLFSAYYSRAKYAESNLLTTYAASHIYPIILNLHNSLTNSSAILSKENMISTVILRIL